MTLVNKSIVACSLGRRWSLGLYGSKTSTSGVPQYLNVPNRLRLCVVEALARET